MKKFSDQELETLLNDTESDRVERKSTFQGDNTRKKKARQAICAFANDLPNPNHNLPGVSA